MRHEQKVKPFKLGPNRSEIPIYNIYMAAPCSGETPYSCNICGKTFSFQQSYHKHMLYHTDEKPHRCRYRLDIRYIY